MTIRSIVLIALAVGLPGFAQAQSRSGVGVVTTLVGEATVARAAAAQPHNLKMRDDVFPLDRISTKERSVVHVLMGGKALLTVRELSVVSVTEESGRATVDLQSGKVGLAVVRERMKPGEVIEVHTPHAVAAVRGTVLVVEIVPGAGGDQPDGNGGATNVHLLHGKLDVSLRSNPGGAPVRLESLQTVTVTRNVLGAMRPLDPATLTAVTTGLRPSDQAVTAVPENLQTAVEKRQGALAIATAAELALAGKSQSAKGLGGKAEPTALVKASESGSSLDAIIPVADTGGTGGLIGSALGAVDGAVSGLGGGGTTSGNSGSTSSGIGSIGSGLSGGSGLGSVLGTSGSGSGSGGNSGPGSGSSSGSGILGGGGLGSGSSGGSGILSGGSSGSGSGGGKGPSLGSGGGGVGNLLAPIVGLPLFKKKP